MPDNQPQIVPDVEGYEHVTRALMDLVNVYPGLNPDEEFSFAMDESEEGFAIFPGVGSGIYDERESITGHVVQMCQYPFTAVYRASGLNQNRKINAKEWLDTFGRWLEKQPVTINGEQVVLSAWPALTGEREIRQITRQTPTYFLSPAEDKSENWLIDMMIQYRNEFDR